MTFKGYKVSEDAKVKISTSLKKAHAQGRHPGWSHRNLDLTRSSYPERWFRNAIANDAILGKCLVVEQLREGKYFLDFAFIEYMVDLEIDGIQHTREEVKIKDSIRNEYLTSIGWHVYRIEWQAMFENPLVYLEDFKTYLLNVTKDKMIFVKSRKIKPEIIKLNVKLRRIADERMVKIKDADIDLTKFGWVQKVADLIDIPPQGINKWMKKYFPEEFKTCFKRKSNSSSVA